MKNNNIKTCKSCIVLGVLGKECPWGDVSGLFKRRCSGGEWDPGESPGTLDAHGMGWSRAGISSWKVLCAVLSSSDLTLEIHSCQTFFNNTILFFFSREN